MATLGFVQVAVDSSGKRLRTTIVEDASTVHQEVMTLAGSTGDLIEPFSQIPSSSAIAYGFRLITGSTSVVAGSVAVSNNVTVLGAGSSAVMGSVLITTGLGGSAIDPRQISATVYPAGLTTPAIGRQVVASASSAVQFGTQACKTVAIIAETDNTGQIVVGTSSVVALLASRLGLPLGAGDTAIFAVDNMNRLWIDSTVSGDGVTWIALS